MLKKVKVPFWVKLGIRKNELAYPNRVQFWGADTETVNGEPYTIQFSDGKNTDLLWVNKNNVLKTFLNYIDPKLWQGQVNIIYFHQLEFDFAVLLYQFHKLWLDSTKLKLHFGSWDIDAVIGKQTFAFFKNIKTNKQLKLLDSRAFFTDIDRAGLGSLMVQLNLPVKKFVTPEGLGIKKLKTKQFIEYAKQDALCEWHLAKWILDQHKEYKIRISVSSPQFASRVFRHYFIRDRDCIRVFTGISRG
jgi:hypothetical protein